MYARHKDGTKKEATDFWECIRTKDFPGKEESVSNQEKDKELDNPGAIIGGRWR